MLWAWGADMEGLGNELDWVAWCKTPKESIIIMLKEKKENSSCWQCDCSELDFQPVNTWVSCFQKSWKYIHQDPRLPGVELQTPEFWPFLRGAGSHEEALLQMMQKLNFQRQGLQTVSTPFLRVCLGLESPSFWSLLPSLWATWAQQAFLTSFVLL